MILSIKKESNSIVAQHTFNLLFIIEKQITNKTWLLIQMVFPICFKIEMNFEIVCADILLVRWSLYILKIDCHWIPLLFFSLSLQICQWSYFFFNFVYDKISFKSIFISYSREKERKVMSIRSTFFILYCFFSLSLTVANGFSFFIPTIISFINLLV